MSEHNKSFTKPETKPYSSSTKKIAYVVGRINLVVRLGGTIAIAILLSKLEHYENLFIVAYSLLLSYLAFSLLLVFLLIIGMYKEYGYCLLPFICIHFLENIMVLVIAIAGTAFIITVKLSIYFAYFIPCLVIVFGCVGFSWISIVKLFFEYEDAEKKETQKNYCGIFVNCWKSDSMSSNEGV